MQIKYWQNYHKLALEKFNPKLLVFIIICNLIRYTIKNQFLSKRKKKSLTYFEEKTSRHKKTFSHYLSYKDSAQTLFLTRIRA